MVGIHSFKNQVPQNLQDMSEKEGYVAEFSNHQDGGGAWNLHLRRNPFNFEIQELSGLLNELDQAKLNREMDNLEWIHRTNGKFSVKSCYQALLRPADPRPAVLGISKEWIWDHQIPERVCFFMWEVNNAAVQTKARLKRIFPAIDSTCLFCKSAEETITHLLLSCPFPNRYREILLGAMASSYLITFPSATDLLSGKHSIGNRL